MLNWQQTGYQVGNFIPTSSQTMSYQTFNIAISTSSKNLPEQNLSKIAAWLTSNEKRSQILHLDG